MDVCQLICHPNTLFQCINLVACMFSPIVNNGMHFGLVMLFSSRESKAGCSLEVKVAIGP